MFLSHSSPLKHIYHPSLSLPFFACFLDPSFFVVIWRTLPAQEEKIVEDLCLVKLCLFKKKSASTKNLDKKTMDFYKTVVSNTHEDETKECMQVFRPFNVFNLLSVFLFVFFKILYYFKTMLLWILINRTCKNIENPTICKNIQNKQILQEWLLNI